MLKFKKFALNEAKTIKVSFHSAAAKAKWMKKQSIDPKEIISQTKNMLELPASMKQYVQPKDHDEIYSTSMKEEVELGEAFKKGDSVTVKNARKYDALSKPEVSGTVIGMNGSKVMVKVGSGQSDRNNLEYSGQMNVDPKDLVKESVKLGEANVKKAAYEKDMNDKKKVIVKGVKGMKSTPFTKTFRNMAAYDKWSDSDVARDYEVRQVMHESVELDEKVNTDKGRKDLLKIVEHVSNAISAHNRIGSDAEKLLDAVPNGVKDYRALYRSLSEAKKVADSLGNNLRNAQRWDAKLLEFNNKETVELDELKMKNSDAAFDLEKEISALERSISRLTPLSRKASEAGDVANMKLISAKKRLKKKQEKYNQLMKEEVDLDEAKLSVGDRVTLQPNKNTLDRSLIGKAGVVTGMVGSKPTVKFANGQTIVVSPNDLKINESVELDEAKVVANVFLWNGKKIKRSFKDQSAAEAWVKKMKDEEDVRDYKMHAESTELGEGKISRKFHKAMTWSKSDTGSPKDMEARVRKMSDKELLNLRGTDDDAKAGSGSARSAQIKMINREIRRRNLDEAFTPKDVKMAIGIASDKRYAGGNMTGAVTAIEKIKKGLSDHPQVKAVLKRQNESEKLDELRNDTLGSYVKKNIKSALKGTMPSNRSAQRTTGINRALDKMRKNDKYKEEVELDELDSKTYRSYHDKATADQLKRMDKAKQTDKDRHTMRKRSLGIATAGMKQYGDKRTVKQWVRGEEVELGEAGSPDRLAIIKKAAQRVKERQAVADKKAAAAAKRDMKAKGAQRGMAPLKKDLDEKSRSFPFQGSNDHAPKNIFQPPFGSRKNMGQVTFLDKDGKQYNPVSKSKSTRREMASYKKDLDEGRNEALKALEALVKNGGIDKANFQKAYDLYKANKLNDLRKHIYSLDTDPGEEIVRAFNRKDSKAFNSMYPRAKPGEYFRKIIDDHGGK